MQLSRRVNEEAREVKEVLVVENEEVWRVRLRNVLERAGYGVTVVASLADIIEALLEAGKPSLVVVDASLTSDASNRDGCEIIKKMGDVPAVCISAHMSPDEVTRLGLMGRFVDKNQFDKRRFLEIVEKSISPYNMQKKSPEKNADAQGGRAGKQVEEAVEKAVQPLQEKRTKMWSDEELDAVVKFAVQPHEEVIRVMKLGFSLLLVEAAIAALYVLWMLWWR
jgi:DNA-binding NtrC family response regulator